MRSAALAAAALLLLILPGCAATVAAPATETATPTATAEEQPTPTPTPTPEPEPRAVFDGDCASAIPQDEIVAAIGEVARVTDAGSEQVVGALPMLATTFLAGGGLSCGWHGPEVGHVGLVALPAERVPDANHEHAAACEFVAYGYTTCSAVSTSGATTIGLSARSERDTAEFETAFADLLARTLDRVAADGGAVLADTPTPSLPSCDELLPVLASVAGGELGRGFPADTLPAGPTWDLQLAYDGLRYCGFSGADNFHFTLQPGMGAPTSEQFPGATDVEVAGAQGGWYGVDPNSEYVLIALTDSGWVTVTRIDDDRERAISYAEAVLAGIDF